MRLTTILLIILIVFVASNCFSQTIFKDNTIDIGSLKNEYYSFTANTEDGIYKYFIQDTTFTSITVKGCDTCYAERKTGGKWQIAGPHEVIIDALLRLIDESNRMYDDARKRESENFMRLIECIEARPIEYERKVYNKKPKK